MAENYVGSRIVDDIRSLRSDSKGIYFFKFKEYLIENKKYKEVDLDTRAILAGIADKVVYFQGSSNWWGFSIKVINEVIEKYSTVYLVMQSHIEMRDDTFYLIKITNEIVTERKRLMITANDNNKLTFTPAIKDITYMWFDIIEKTVNEIEIT